MKKIFAQPEMTVVIMNNRDIVTESMGMLGDYNSSTITIAAPGQRNVFDEWYEGY